MAIRTIVKVGDPILREVCRGVTVFDKNLGRLLDDMAETMFDADGVGLAAPQIGIARRICVVSPDRETVFELINPVIESAEGSQVFNEGCLSIPGRSGEVTRPEKVVVSALDRDGKEFTVEADGYLAVILCHEIDHLDGILYTDRLSKAGL